MNYSVTIGFSRSKKIMSKLIRWFTTSGVSHVYIKRSTPHVDPNFIVYQASGLLVNVENYDHFLTHAEPIKEFEMVLSDDKYAEAEAFLLRELGKPYSILQLLGMLWVILCRRFGARVKNPFRDGDHSYICVELVAKLLGIQGAEEMTPQDLLELLEAHQVDL